MLKFLTASHLKSMIYIYQMHTAMQFAQKLADCSIRLHRSLSMDSCIFIAVQETSMMWIYAYS